MKIDRLNNWVLYRVKLISFGETLVISPKDIKDTIMHYLDCAIFRIEDNFEDIPNRFDLLKKDLFKIMEELIDKGDN